MCEVLGVSTSGYYAWRSRGPSIREQQDATLKERIRHYHQRSDGTYGSPRIHEDLLEKEGLRIGTNRVARLMREMGLRGVCRRRTPQTTRRSHSGRGVPDLVDRDFSADAPNQLWVADITYVPTARGFLFLSVVLDVFSRRIVGWAMERRMETDLVLSALSMAVEQRQPSGVIHHSDQGSQYTSVAFGSRCREAGVRPSTGSVGDCYDNAMCESFFATLECELIDRYSFDSRKEARLSIFNFIEGWYNPHRRHSGIEMMSPMDYEHHHAQQLTPSSP